MRILHIVDNLSVRSGVSSFIINLYRNIDRSRMQFDFLVMNHSEESYEDEIKELGGKIFYIKSPISVRNIFFSMHQSKLFFKKNRSEYSVVHLHSPTTCFFNLRYAKRYNIKNRIIHSHSTMFSNNMIKKVINKLLCLNIKKYANNYWACSLSAAKFLYGEYIEGKNMCIINNAIECKTYKFNEITRNIYRKNLNLENKHVIGIVGTFNEIKNQKFIIEVFKEINEVNDEFILILVGNGPLYQECINYSKELKLNNKIKFLGFRSDINNLLQCFDLLVLPSIKEGLPYVVVEAQSAGLPCLLSSSITREVNLGYCDYIDLDKKKWKEKILMKKLNENRVSGYYKVKNSRFNIKTEVKKIMNLYNELDRS